MEEVKTQIKRNSKKSFLIAKIIVFIIFALYAFTLFYAMLWALGMSLKGQEEYYSNPNGFPQAWLFSNYITAFKSVQVDGNNMIVMFINSLWYACGGAVLQVIASAVVAYAVAKYKFPGRGFMYGLALVTMMIPIVGSFPSQYKRQHRSERNIHFLCIGLYIAVRPSVLYKAECG